MTAVHLVRHGQSDWNAARRLQGQSDEPVLTELGQIQAGEAAERMRSVGVSSILSSDLRRTRQTAEIIGTRLEVPVRLDPRLREQSLGKFEGFALQAALDATEGHDWTDADAALEAGESLRDVAVRITPLVEEIRSGLYGDQVVLVSHGDTIRVALTVIAAQDGAPDLGGIQYASPANGSVTTVNFT
ncbi:probable phosphoglycerate mutase [Jatrophihabitans sp. GAS493]|uniref:histidine phosphatase family protein n=1 Tax=Jatrophihabitans sp. GAS493 TaxID=1907575 RepID=UPI000BB93D29|nr:histidine phosphatase family protein [Jatrophihabitans sp. GAS493]SOD74480.1 probable phosphoglycerate mutase [Jatrophihabitans sp. GAS493]